MASRIVAEHGCPALEYNQPFWGDVICGTKDQLQALGIGLNLAFPGEPGGFRRSSSYLDHRGFKARIERHDDVCDGWLLGASAQSAFRTPDFPGGRHA